MEIEAALERIKSVVGPRGWVADPGEQEPYLVEARRLYRGATRMVVRPASTEEVAAVVRISAEAGLPIVPQGGNTGLVGGGVPPEDGHNIVLALGRMNRIRAIDPVNFTMTVEAGCILAHLHPFTKFTSRMPTQKPCRTSEKPGPMGAGFRGCRVHRHPARMLSTQHHRRGTPRKIRSRQTSPSLLP